MKLSSNQRRFIGRAIQLSTLSTYERVQIGALVVSPRGVVIGQGFNQPKSHPLQYRDNNQVPATPEATEPPTMRYVDAIIILRRVVGCGLLAAHRTLQANGFDSHRPPTAVELGDLIAGWLK